MALCFQRAVFIAFVVALQDCHGEHCMEGPPLPNRPFLTVWNTPVDKCKDKWNVSLDLDAFDFVVNRNQTWCGEYIVIFYNNQLGLYPFFDSDGKAVNGGLPQLVNLTEHFMKVEEDIGRVIPDPDFQGIGVIDWEYWRPVFDRNWDTYSIYRRKSMDLVRTRYPSVPDSLVEVMARMQFEAAAQQFMEGTILYVQKLRPKSHWGFYGFPDCYNEKNAEPCSNSTRKQNDQISWMFESSSALFPSIYLYDERINYTSYVKYRLLEGFRHSRKSDGQIIPVYPYVRITYAVSEIYLDLEDIIATVVQSAEEGVPGIVIWGDYLSDETKIACTELKTYVDNYLGLVVKNLTTITQACSAQFCSSHGRCRFKWNSLEHQKAMYLQHSLHLTEQWKFLGCRCYNKWSSKNCGSPSLE